MVVEDTVLHGVGRKAYVVCLGFAVLNMHSCGEIRHEAIVFRAQIAIMQSEWVGADLAPASEMN